MSTQADLEQGYDELEQTSTEQSSTTTQVKPNQKPNWRDDPDYVKQQAALQREAALAKKAAWQAEERAAAIQRQYQEDRISRMSEQEQIVARYQLALQELDAVKQQRELDAFAIRRKYDLEQISQNTGAPISELEDIEKYPTVHDAWLYAISYEKKNKGKASRSRQEEIDDEADNRVDVVSSKSRSTKAELQERYNAARKSYSQRKQIEILAEADSLGIVLKED